MRTQSNNVAKEMAVDSATSNGTTDESHLEEIDKCKKGWLLKKTHYTKRWKQLWFHIRDGNLFYGVNEEVRVNDADFGIKPPQCFQALKKLTPVISLSVLTSAHPLELRECTLVGISAK